MELLLLAFGWLAFIMVASLFAAYAIDWIQDRNMPFVERMNVISRLSCIEGQVRKLTSSCSMMRAQIDSYERSWVSAGSFCRLEDKVERTLKTMQVSILNIQRRTKALESNLKEETK